MMSYDFWGVSEHGLPAVCGHLDVEKYDEPMDLGVVSFQPNPCPIWGTCCILVERCMAGVAAQNFQVVW